VVELPLIPFLYSEQCLSSRRQPSIGRHAVTSQRLRISRERWPLVAARARQVGLRNAAREFGVSHETVRAIARAFTADDSLSKDLPGEGHAI